jgi:hypothetical protein
MHSHLQLFIYLFIAHCIKVIFIRPNFIIDHTDTGSIALVSASKIVDTCLQNTKTALPSSLSDQDKSAAIELMSSCIQSSTAKQIEIAHEEVQFQSEIRTDMSHMLENYTCYDETLPTSKAKTTANWMARHVDVMLDRPSAKIHFISDFITQEECDAIHWEVKDDLKDADVSDGKGGRTLDPGRSAKTAPIRNVNDATHARLIEQLSRRIYNYTNHVLPFNVTDEGQQDLMFIQYYGRGINNKKPDRYLPHCDGDCDGRAFKDGGRIATMLMYCDIAKRGGATNFMNAGITVRPKKYSATFFSYINPGTMMMDDGLTQHSGCPVIEGEKRIVTLWVRLGVDEENPWDSYNTCE